MKVKQDNHIIKVLQVTIGDGSFGGVASFMYSFYSHMDHEKIHCDFLYCGENSMQSKEDSPVLKNSKIITLHVMKPQNNGFGEYVQLIKKLKVFFKDNNYDIVHVNSANIIVNACVAYTLNGRAYLISHSHSAKNTSQNKTFKELTKNAIKNYSRKYILKKADHYFACSKAAGEKMFGLKALKSDKFKLVNNAIELSMYIYNTDIRKTYRKTKKIVIGYVGRLAAEKNPIFSIEVFSEIYKLNQNTEFWMIGEGELLNDIRKRINTLGIEENVTLWGRRNDVANLMQAMDIVILPSLFEGLSIVAVEAQTAGLPVYASDSISEEHRVTDLVHFLPLTFGASAWAAKIVKDMENMPKRKNMLSEMTRAGYEIGSASKWLEDFYFSVVKIDE